MCTIASQPPTIPTAHYPKRPLSQAPTIPTTHHPKVAAATPLCKGLGRLPDPRESATTISFLCMVSCESTIIT